MLYSIPKLIKYFEQEKPDVIFSYLQGLTPLIVLTQKTKEKLSIILNTEKITYIPNPIIDANEINNKALEEIQDNFFRK